MSELPTDNQVTAAILCAARICDENPLAVIDGVPRSRARIYAYMALRSLLKDARSVDIATLCGADAPMSLASNAGASVRLRWWDDATLRSVKKAIAGVKPAIVTPDAAPSPVPVERDAAWHPVQPRRHRKVAKVATPSAQPSLPEPTPAMPPPMLSTMRRVIDRRVSGPVNLGDPEPGRSALAQGYRPGSGLVRERA